MNRLSPNKRRGRPRLQTRTPFDQLVRGVAVRVPQPVDALEIASVIESMGITDAAAESIYASDDVFALAERAFPQISRRAQHAQGHGSDDPQAESRERTRKATLDAAMSTLLTLIPFLVVALSTRGLADRGISGGETIAITIGVSAAMIGMSGPLLAIARQAAIYRGFDYLETADRFVRRAGLQTAAAGWLVAAVCGGVLFAAGLGVTFAALFALSFGGFATVWSFATSLVAAGRVAVVGYCMLIGISAAAGAFWVRPVATGPVGIAVAALGLSAALMTITHRDGALTRPSWRFLAADGAPYAAYGLILTVFLAAPHIVAGLAAGSLRSFSRFELSFSVALMPIVCSAALLERLLYGFWGFIRQTERRLGPQEFALVTLQLARWKFLFFAGTLALLSVIAGFAVAFLRHHAPLISQSSVPVVVIALFGFWFFGCAQFVSLLLLNLGRPRAVVAAAGAGVVVCVAVAALVALLFNADVAALGFVGGAFVFLILATSAANKTFQDIDHYYASAF